MRLLYTKPKLKDMSQGSRIAFARQFRLMTQDNVSDKLGLTGECKRRTMTSYEKENRNPKEDRTREIANILEVNYNAIKKYDFIEIIDVIYYVMWLEELLPNYQIDLSNVYYVDEKQMVIIRNFINEWNLIRNKRQKREITYNDYINWKLNYTLEEK
ncbi:MAG: helix-turn-helix transcriptional regulator [Bacilli bacterium]|nr:helix-turn-helix transcriptional regulator [Bacilli bacterium]